jgi:hypothetical protein
MDVLTAQSRSSINPEDEAIGGFNDADSAGVA